MNGERKKKKKKQGKRPPRLSAITVSKEDKRPEMRNRTEAGKKG